MPQQELNIMHTYRTMKLYIKMLHKSSEILKANTPCFSLYNKLSHKGTVAQDFFSVFLACMSKLRRKYVPLYCFSVALLILYSYFFVYEVFQTKSLRDPWNLQYESTNLFACL